MPQGAPVIRGARFVYGPVTATVTYAGIGRPWPNASAKAPLWDVEIGESDGWRRLPHKVREWFKPGHEADVRDLASLATFHIIGLAKTRDEGPRSNYLTALYATHRDLAAALETAHKLGPALERARVAAESDVVRVNQGKMPEGLVEILGPKEWRPGRPEMGAIPEDVGLRRPRTGALPLKAALQDIFGPAAARLYPRILERVREEPVRHLGEGEKGVAYLLPSGRVLKLTADPDEVRAVALLVGRDLRNVVRVHDAFAVRDGETGVGIIVRNAVDAVLGEAGRYPNLVTHLRFSVTMANEFYRKRRKELHVREALWEAMLFLAETVEGEPARTLDHHERALIPGILNAVRELNGAAIYTIDFGPGNIGLVDGEPVLFDLSNASVPEDMVEVLG